MISYPSKDKDGNLWVKTFCLDKKIKDIVDDMKSTKNKTSAGEHKKKVASFSQAAKKKRRIIAAETKTEGVHITAAVGTWIIVN